MADHAPGEARRIPARGVAVLIAMSAVVVAVATVAAERWFATTTPNIRDIAFAGSAAGISEQVAQQNSAYQRALWVDLGLILGYGFALTAGNYLALVLSFTAAARRLSSAALSATAVVVVCGIGENLMLLLVLDGAGGDGVAVAAQAFAFTTWSLGIPVAVVAAVGVATATCRAIRPGLPEPPTVIRPAAEHDPGLSTEPSGGLGGQRAVWRANSMLPEFRLGRAQGGAAGIGFCVSGGGIRAATITFGALESLREVLTRSRWLVSVSGGGYAAGAMQLALQQLPQQEHEPAGRRRGRQSVAQAEDVYRCGSSELDYTRKHGRYLADGTREWLGLGITVLRGFLINVVTLGLLVVLLGRLLAHVYASIAPDLMSWTAATPLPGVRWAVGVLVVAWLLFWTISVLFEPAWRRLTRVLRATGSAALAVAVVVGLAGVGLPLLAWAFRTPPSDSVAVGSPTVSLVGGYLAALLALGKRPSVRDALSKAASQGRAWWRNAGAGSRNLIATVGVYAGLFALLSGFVMLFGAVLAHTGPITGTSSWPGRYPEWMLTLGVAGTLCLLAAVDQVRWSLHPFYRRRLAGAFAVRRVREGGQVQARPYDYDTETTALHTYGTRRPDFPELIFSCAAHVSGQSVAPPGRRVVPWTLSGEHIGGQVHGWVATEELYRSVSATLQHDLTVEAAQAISGATLASQMGVQQRVYAKFLTLTNIRLGSWLPNPAYLHQIPAAEQSWAMPRLPRRRHLTTLLQELIGAFPTQGPLVYVTDGGHYENLGLVELLRRRPAVVYCVDASGDQRDVPRSLAHAIELAHEELGITLNFEGAAWLGARPDQPQADPTDQLSAQMSNRLAPTCVVTGTIHYPDLGPSLPPAEGKIVVGKAVLTAETPFHVLAYGNDHLDFPSDSASDQWFDAAQFDAYHSLGRHVGARMGAELPLPDDVTHLDVEPARPVADNFSQPVGSGGGEALGAPAAAAI